MPFAAILIGAVLIVAALQGTHATLASELETDVPAFFKWALAIVAILALGFVPGLKTPSRLLLVLVAVVLVLSQYKNILASIYSFAGSGSTAATGTTAANVATAASIADILGVTAA